MKSNILVFCLVAGVAALLGIGISVKLANDPLLARIVDQQQQILGMQHKLDRQLTAPEAAKPGEDRVKVLENRVAALEQKIEALTGLLQKMPPMPSQRPEPPQEDLTKVYDIPVGKTPVLGKADAKVTIVGFLDLQCPFSARFQPVIDQVLAAYPGKVKFMIKHFPLSFHPEAKPAAKAVLAAGEQGKYFEMLELILKDNRSLSDEKLKEFATTLKLNLKKFDADLKSKDAEYEQLINSEFELGTKVAVQGTPTYYVNGRKTMSRDLNGFKQEIDAILGAK